MKLTGIKEKYEVCKNRCNVASTGIGVVGFSVLASKPAFAAAVVTNTQMDAITTDITANLAVILPVGLAILGIMIGIALIPRIIYKFF